MPLFLHNPALILTDSIKQPNLQLSIWPYLLHSSFALASPLPFLSLFPCPPLHLLILNKIFFIFFASSASFSFSLSLPDHLATIFFSFTFTHSVAGSLKMTEMLQIPSVLHKMLNFWRTRSKTLDVLQIIVIQLFVWAVSSSRYSIYWMLWGMSGAADFYLPF